MFTCIGLGELKEPRLNQTKISKHKKIYIQKTKTAFKITYSQTFTIKHTKIPKSVIDFKNILNEQLEPKRGTTRTKKKLRKKK